MTRLLDRMMSRRDTGYWEGLASGAAVLTTSYGSPDREALLPQFTDWAKRAHGGNGVVFSAFVTRMMLLSDGAVSSSSRRVTITCSGTPSLAISGEAVRA